LDRGGKKEGQGGLGTRPWSSTDRHRPTQDAFRRKNIRHSAAIANTSADDMVTGRKFWPKQAGRMRPHFGRISGMFALQEQDC